MNGLKVNQDKIKNCMGMGDFGQKAKADPKISL